MVAVIFYDLDFDVDSGNDYANVYADVSIDSIYVFDTKEQLAEYKDELREAHPGKKWTYRTVTNPAAEAAERDKYQMRMDGDWS